MSSGTDDSTFARIIEVKRAMFGLSSSFYYPLQYLFGLGSGALWFPVEDLGHGIAHENYRASGGIHHIHMEWASLYFRHGLIGLLLYVLWVAYVLKTSLKLSFAIKRTNYKLYAMLGAISFYCVGALTIMLTDSFIYGHFTFGLLAAVTDSFQEFILNRGI